MAREKKREYIKCHLTATGALTLGNWAELDGVNPQGAGLAGTSGVPISGWTKPVDATLERAGSVEWVIADYGRHSPDLEAPTKGLLERFLRLDGAPAERVRDFVKRFGLLEAPTEVVQNRSSGGIDRQAEQVSVYHHYARLLRAALTLHRRLHAGLGVDQEDMSFIREFIRKDGLGSDWVLSEQFDWGDGAIPPPGGYGRKLWVVIQWIRVSAVLNWWFEEGHVRPVLIMDPNTLMVRWSGGLWGAIGGQALFAIRQEANVAVCDYCDREFALSRRPRSNAKRRCCPRSRCVRKRRAESMRLSRGR